MSVKEWKRSLVQNESTRVPCRNMIDEMSSCLQFQEVQSALSPIYDGLGATMSKCARLAKDGTRETRWFLEDVYDNVRT